MFLVFGAAKCQFDYCFLHLSFFRLIWRKHREWLQKTKVGNLSSSFSQPFPMPRYATYFPSSISFAGLQGFFPHVCFVGFMTLSFAWLGFSNREPRVVTVHILQSDLKIKTVAIVLSYRPLNYIEILRRKHSMVIFIGLFYWLILLAVFCMSRMSPKHHHPRLSGCKLIKN